VLQLLLYSVDLVLVVVCFVPLVLLLKFGAGA
jgi:hypothetical protein